MKISHYFAAIFLVGLVILTGSCAVTSEKAQTEPAGAAVSGMPAQEPPLQPSSQPPAEAAVAPLQPAEPEQPVTAAPTTKLIAPPLPDAPRRITKKPFGIYVTPNDSPVSPERFRGYHSGVDFEAPADEQDTDMPVSAICSGSLLLKKWAGGYGGVAVQKCVIAGDDVTVIYGHLRLASIKDDVGAQLAAGASFAVLGRGYGPETDGERKHLHLGIHRGEAVVLLGYVPKISDLDQWLDAQALLEK